LGFSQHVLLLSHVQEAQPGALAHAVQQSPADAAKVEGLPS
jgi:hypothetical protein